MLASDKLSFLTNTVLYALFIFVAVCWNPFHHKFTRGVTYCDKIAVYVKISRTLQSMTISAFIQEHISSHN